jgi:hypothetical protein
MFKYFVNLRAATIRLQLSAERFQEVLAHFGQSGSLQLRLVSGETYHQGSNWYLVMLNDHTFAPEVAASRFLDAIRVALAKGKLIAASKERHAELANEFQRIVRPFRVIPVKQVVDHGRLRSVAKSHLVSALANRDAELTRAIKKIEARIPDPFWQSESKPASPEALQSLSRRFSRPSTHH